MKLVIFDINIYGIESVPVETLPANDPASVEEIPTENDIPINSIVSNEPEVPIDQSSLPMENPSIETTESIPVQTEQVDTTPITPEFDIEAELALREKRALRFNSPFDKEATRKSLLEEHRKKEAAQFRKSIKSLNQPVSIFNKE